MNNIRYSYMDHWEIHTAAGLTSPGNRINYLERYLKELRALGYQGLDTFAARLPFYGRLVAGNNGTPVDFENYLKDLGFERLVSMFLDFIGNNPAERIADPACHDQIFNKFRAACEMAKGTGIDTFIVMPACQYFYTDPVTEDHIRHTADFWNRTGKMMLEDYGIHAACHHEFWCGLRDKWAIDLFYELTDPKYVFYFCDTAQHVIAGVDPVALYEQLHDRTWGFHLMDTKNTDPKAYRIPPDAECMAEDVERWFYEANGEGLCDFPALYRAIKKYGFSGWISSEHDKAEFEGKSFADCTAQGVWYIKHVLDPILKEGE